MIFMNIARAEIDGHVYTGIISDDRFYKITDFTDIKFEKTIDEMVYLVNLKKNMDKPIFVKDIKFLPLIDRAEKIIGIGLNYRAHAADLDTKSPSVYPVLFIKPNSVIIGAGDKIKIPKLSNRTTAEAELGIVIAKECRDIEEKDWRQYVLGFTTILDMTAEDLLRMNTRYLELSKIFDTFLSIGPELITDIDNIEELEITTVKNNEIIATNTVSNMIFSLPKLISFISSVTTLYPGDIISTGTPGAVHIEDGDTIECRITGFRTLKNSVIDLKIAE